MMETLSHKFLEALAPPRDRLYALALALAGTPAAAEGALLKAARSTFARTAANEFLNIPAAVEKSLAEAAPVGGASAGPGGAGGDARGADAPAGAEPAASGEAPGAAGMPADVWARLAAAVQWEAARSTSAGALHPDSQLLKPDPMLAPRQPRSRLTRQHFDAETPKRMLALIGMALLIGVLLTIYILTRPPGTPGTMPMPQTVPSSTRG